MKHDYSGIKGCACGVIHVQPTAAALPVQSIGKYCNNCGVKITGAWGEHLVVCTKASLQWDLSKKKNKQEKGYWSYFPTSALDAISIAWKKSNKPEGKYNKHDWRTSDISWSENYDSLMHHLSDYIEGKDTDPESKCLALAHAGCRILMALEMQIKGLGKDDRYKEKK